MNVKRLSRAEASILKGLSQAVAFAKGDTAGARVTIVDVPDTRSMRRKLHMSQAKFAASFGLSLRTVQEWEQGRARPEGPARVLLTLIEREPQLVRRALALR